MQVRAIRIGGLAVAFVAGAALPPNIISVHARPMLVSFLGLFSASLLPTISLLVNGMTAGGRSVHAIERLDVELTTAMDALFLLFGCTVVAFFSFVALSLIPEAPPAYFPIVTTELLPRLGQAIAIAAITTIVWRGGQIPAILRRTLAMRKDIAIEEARRKLIDKAPDASAVRKAFSTHADFGNTIKLEDVPEREPS